MKLVFLRFLAYKIFNSNERSKKFFINFKLPEESKKNYVDGTFRIPIKMFIEAGSPLQNGLPTYKQGIDIGPDLVREVIHNPNDPLTERTPLPKRVNSQMAFSC